MKYIVKPKIEKIEIKNNNYKKIEPKFISVILFFLSYLLYFLSLEKCYSGIDICSKNIKWILRKLLELITSCIIMSILIELIFYKLISKFHIIHITIIFSLYYEYSHGMDFDDHGLFNFIGYLILQILILISIVPFNILLCIMKRKNKFLQITYIITLFSSFISILIIYNSNIINCDEWPKGLNNSYIENNSLKYGCQIVFPKICPYKLLNKIQDYTKIFKKNCKNYLIHGSKNKLIEKSRSPFINDKVKRIGYPLTNKDPICNLDMINNKNFVEEYFFKNLVDMDDIYVLQKYYKDKTPEVEVDFTNNTQGKLLINLHYNETLSKERFLLENKTKPYSQNVMVLYIDSVSRANSIRKLKKTLKFVEQFMNFKGGYNKKFPTENFHSFQFFKYHAFKFHTSDNFPILFFGQLSDLKKVIITKYFKENGYITGYAGDFCYKDNIRTYHNSSLNEVYDHQFLICDPNNEHFNSYRLNCLYGKPTTQHLYDYGLQFWKKYKDNRKFLVIVSNDGHEGTLEVLKYIDDIIYNYLINLYNHNLLKESTIFLLSDHGVGMPSFYYLFKFYSIEENLGMLYIIINDRKRLNYDQQYKFIYENQQTFITGFDIYNTFGNIIFGDDYKSIKNKTLVNDTAKSPLGISLFQKINPKNRSPKIYQLSSTINPKYCK